MPVGLADRLTESELADLVAFLAAARQAAGLHDQAGTRRPPLAGPAGERAGRQRDPPHQLRDRSQRMTLPSSLLRSTAHGRGSPAAGRAADAPRDLCPEAG